MITALILAAPGFETMELTVTADYMIRAGIQVTIAAVGTTDLEVSSQEKIAIKADVMIKDVANKTFDIVVAPGGYDGTMGLARDKTAIEIVQKQIAAGRYLCGICAAPGFFFANACGIMKGRKATGYPGCTEPITKNGGTEVNQDVVVDGKLITARGPAFAPLFGMTIVEAVCGKEKAAQVAKGALFK